MTTWTLSPQYKKSAVEKMFFYKDGKCITIEQGFRWANFTVESDERPLTDDELKNEDGYELGCIDNDECWEMSDMTDGCWIDISNDSDVSDEDFAAFEAAWEEDGYCGVEELGWSNDDTEYYYFGPLELTNDDTGEVFCGEPEENVSVSGVPAMPEAPADLTPEEKKQIVKEQEAEVRAEQAAGAKWPFSSGANVTEPEEPKLTKWFDATKTCPQRKGNYQIIDKESSDWPFPSYAVWSGKKWNVKNVLQWRGLAKDPGAK